MKSRCVQILLAAGLTVLLASSASAEGAIGSDNSGKTSGIEGLHLKAGESFLKARSRIIRLGWKPIRMHSNDNYEYDGAEKRLADRSFREVDSCSIDAGANCILYYTKATKCLRIDTVGEQVDQMQVTRWTNECPVGKS
jgi:hypothetical protein